MSMPKAARHAAYRMWGKKCRKCGTKKNMSLHHLDGDSNRHDPINLMPLCRECHDFVEMIIRLHRKGCEKCNTVNSVTATR